MRATTHPRRLTARVAMVAVAALTLSSCSSSSHPAAAPLHSAISAAHAAANLPGKAVDACKLATAQELSQAAGVQYTAIEGYGTGTLCNVTGAQVTNNFILSVEKEGAPPDTWNAELATIKRDDGSETSVSGIGDHAVQGAVKEFAVEAKGYIVGVIDADFNNPPTAKTFARSKKIAQLLISKL